MSILAFHSVDDRFSIGINNYKYNKFNRLCEYLKATDYTLYPLSRYLEGGDDFGKKLCLTFDDGYKSFFETALPVMKGPSIPAAVFIPSGFIGRKNSWEYSSFITPREHLSALEIRRLAESGVEIGSHGHSHVALTRLSDRFLRIELEKSKKILEDIIGRPVDFISFPFGRVNLRVEEMAMAVGYRRGLSLVQTPPGIGGFTLRRSAIYAWDTPYSISAKIGEEPLKTMERFKEKVINFYSGGTILLNQIRGKKLPTAN